MAGVAGPEGGDTMLHATFGGAEWPAPALKAGMVRRTRGGCGWLVVTTAWRTTFATGIGCTGVLGMADAGRGDMHRVGALGAGALTAL